MVDVSQEFDPSLVRITQSYVQRLREKGLVQNIISRIKVGIFGSLFFQFPDLTIIFQSLLRIKSSAYRRHFDVEIRQLALILFYLQHNVGLDIQQTSSDLPNVKAVIQLASMSFHIYDCGYSHNDSLPDDISRQIPKTIRESSEKEEILQHAQSITTV